MDIFETKSLHPEMQHKLMKLSSPVDMVKPGVAKHRWYDLDGTLRTAISLLQNCPDSTRSVIAKEMAKNVIDIIKKEEDVDDVELDIPEE